MSDAEQAWVAPPSNLVLNENEVHGWRAGCEGAWLVTKLLRVVRIENRESRHIRLHHNK